MRNHMVRRAVGLAVAGALVMTSIFGGPVSQAAPKTKKIVMNAKAVELQVGKTFTLKVKKVTPKKASKAVTYKTSNKKVATVSKKGVIMAIKAGEAKITITSKKNKKAKVTVKVRVSKRTTVVRKSPAPAASNQPNIPTGSRMPIPSSAPTESKAPVQSGTPTNSPAPKKSSIPVPTLPPKQSSSPAPKKSSSPIPASSLSPLAQGEKRLDLSKAEFKGGEIYNAATKTISVDTADATSMEIYLPLPDTVAIGQTLSVTISGPKWGSEDFRIWTTPSDRKYSGDYVEDAEIYLTPTVRTDGSFTGTVQVKAKDKECSYITLKSSHNTSVTGLMISDVKVKLGAAVGGTTTAPSTAPSKSPNVPAPSKSPAASKAPGQEPAIPWQTLDLSRMGGSSTTFSYDASTKSLTFTGGEYASIPIPAEASLGETVTVRVTGVVGADSEGFRAWLGARSNQATMVANNEWISSLTAGAFDITKELVVVDKDNKGNTAANCIAFKGRAAGKTLAGLTIQSVQVFYGSIPAVSPTPEKSMEPSPAPEKSTEPSPIPG